MYQAETKDSRPARDTKSISEHPSMTEKEQLSLERIRHEAKGKLLFAIKVSRVNFTSNSNSFNLWLNKCRLFAVKKENTC